MPRPAKKGPRSPRRAGAVLVPYLEEEKAEVRSAANRDERPLAQWIRVITLREARRGKE